MDAYKKATRELEAEMERQIDLIYTSSAIAFCRYWGWKAKRIKSLFDETQKTWDECASSNNISMLQMLENETGIELKRPDSDRSWHEVAYLNTGIEMGELTAMQWIYMRQQQKKWVGCQILACMFLSLHRRQGFGPERLLRVMSQIEEIRDEFKWDRKALLKACAEETGIVLASGKVSEVRDEQRG